MAAEQRHIDNLLQRYLCLLDEYVRLRASLSDLQRDVYQNIARANFSAERGMRYGQDSYDERMRASRLLTIDRDEAHVPVFAVNGASSHAPTPTATAADDEKQPVDEHEQSGEEHHVAGEEADRGQTAKDPLRWFGLLAPTPLRKAQSLSVDMVEHVIPQLASVHAEMLTVEIAVRRARKRRAKGLAPEGQNRRETVETV